MFLDILTKEEKEALLNKKMEEIRRKNEALRKRHEVSDLIRTSKLSIYFTLLISTCKYRISPLPPPETDESETGYDLVGCYKRWFISCDTFNFKD